MPLQQMREHLSKLREYHGLMKEWEVENEREAADAQTRLLVAVQVIQQWHRLEGIAPFRVTDGRALDDAPIQPTPN